MRRLQPIAFADVTPFIVDDPIRIDLAVKNLQAQFDTLPWLEKSFARAVKRSETVNEQDQSFPAMFVGKDYDYLRMIGQDNFQAYSFFFADDPETTVNYQDNKRNYYERDLNAIFWMNLSLIDPNVGAAELLESLKRDIINKIKTTRYLPNSAGDFINFVDIIGIYDKPEEIFEGFTISLTNSQMLYYPYGGLRFQLKVNYLASC